MLILSSTFTFAVCSHQTYVASLHPANNAPEVCLASWMEGGGQHLCELSTTWLHLFVFSHRNTQSHLTLICVFSVDPPLVSGVR